MKNRNSMDLWYVGYGSNLFSKRFRYYIQGGQFPGGGKCNERCEDSKLPKETRLCIIPHRLFFANKSSGWEDGSVAFISPNPDKNAFTYGRMWKVTEKQFLHIWNEEGCGNRWYNTKIDLGKDENGIPICTITNSSERPANTPKEKYLQTLIAGLRETYHLSNETILNYLIEKPGIKDNLTKEKLLKIINSN